MSDTFVHGPTSAGRAGPDWQPVGDRMPTDLDGPRLLIGTRKGAWILAADAARQHWAASGPAFLGHIVQHIVIDPRDRATMLMATKTGHLGPTVFRSTDGGRSWNEAGKPPAFRAG